MGYELCTWPPLGGRRPRHGDAPSQSRAAPDRRSAPADGDQDPQEVERRQLAEKWPSSDFVFTTPIGTPVDPDNCSKLVKAALKQAGVRPVRMHDFRHGCVSVLLGLGVPPRTVMENAGHTALEMTMNVYAHVTLDDKRDALDKLGDLFGEVQK